MTVEDKKRRHEWISRTNLCVCLSVSLSLSLSVCFSVSGSLRSVCGWTQSYQFGPVSRGFWWRWLSLCRMFWTMVSSSRRSTAEPESFWTRSGCWRNTLSRPSRPSHTWRYASSSKGGLHCFLCLFHSVNKPIQDQQCVRPSVGTSWHMDGR